MTIADIATDTVGNHYYREPVYVAPVYRYRRPYRDYRYYEDGYYYRSPRRAIELRTPNFGISIRR
jgi:hypothetical protein